MLELVSQARAAGETAAQATTLVGWSRATLYRYRRKLRRFGREGIPEQAPGRTEPLWVR